MCAAAEDRSPPASLPIHLTTWHSLYVPSVQRTSRHSLIMYKRAPGEETLGIPIYFKIGEGGREDRGTFR